MKKYLLYSVSFLFVAGAAFGVWKFEVYKKLPMFKDRVPASVQETAPSEFDESEFADKEKADDFKIKLEKKPTDKVKVATVKKSKSKPEVKDMVKHVVTQDETAWFLANVYYGKGPQFEDILAANEMKDAKEIKEGMEIYIPNPKFHKGQTDFAARYTQVWEKRAEALKARNKSVDANHSMLKSPMPASKVVLPTEKIRAKDTTPSFPFTEVKNPHKSPAEMAKEVLREASMPQE